MDSGSRSEFFAGLQPGGKYDGIIGIYRHNISTDRIGIFDKELVLQLPSTVKWIAHNGAGYDQIDVAACKERGECPIPSRVPLSSSQPFSALLSTNPYFSDRHRSDPY